jgi:hypothetical protein
MIKLKCFIWIHVSQLIYITPIVRSIMSSTAAAATAPKKYRTHYICSWYAYQKTTPSHLHSIEHYNADCEERAKYYDEHVMVIRNNVTKITGWHWCTGWPAQNCADHDGYVDVRTGKKYSLQGEDSFFKEIGI